MVALLLIYLALNTSALQPDMEFKCNKIVCIEIKFMDINTDLCTAFMYTDVFGKYVPYT